MIEDFGPYRIIRRIAVGGMAEIYLARQRGIEGVERTVVLKRILPSFSTDDEFVTMFLDEARLLAALSHPNIAQVFDLGTIEEAYYLVMEYVRGPALGAVHKAALRSGAKSLPEKEVLGITLGLAEALAYTHELRDELGRPLNIVHRDLNPANVLVSYDGAVKLIDFGIAKTATKVYETRTGVIKGTYGYIAPEQLSRSANVDHRADVFALGVVLYEMSVGQHPFDASDEPNLIDRILRARYRRPRQVVPTFPKRLDALIAACLDPEPKNRPDSMRTFITEVTAHLVDVRAYPTMGDIATLVRSLVPDKEGPAPLRPLTQVKPKPKTARGVDSRPEPTNTIRLSAQDVEAAAKRTGSDEHTIRVDIDAPLPPITPDELDDAADTLIAASLSQNRPLKTKVRAGRSDPPRAREPSITPVPSVRPLPKSTPPKKGRPWLAAAGTVVLLGGAGAGAYVAAQQINDPSRHVRADAGLVRDAGAPSMDAPIDTAPEPMLLMVRSEPAGATVMVGMPTGLSSIEWQTLEEHTPTEVTFPSDANSVWIRVTLDGYQDTEREITAGLPEAVFNLIASTPSDAGVADGGPPDADTASVDPEETPPQGRKRAKNVRRRGR